jgi:hypothetical protein
MQRVAPGDSSHSAGDGSPLLSGEAPIDQSPSLQLIIGEGFRLVLEDAFSVLGRLGLGNVDESPERTSHDFNITDANAASLMERCESLYRVGIAVFIVTMLSVAMRLVLMVMSPIWSFWIACGISALFLGLIARHAQLQLRAQLEAHQALSLAAN